jgi:hypothetical protein
MDNIKCATPIGQTPEKPGEGSPNVRCLSQKFLQVAAIPLLHSALSARQFTNSVSPFYTFCISEIGRSPNKNSQKIPESS